MNFKNDGRFKKTHGMSRTRTYKSWVAMKERCLNPKASGYSIYGGRGIRVCQRWLDGFENFYADMGARPERMTLDRINGNGDYEPENCRWATYSEQASNRRVELFEVDGIAATLTEHAKRVGIRRETAATRLVRGWPVSDLLLKPQKKGVNHAVQGR